MSPLEINYYLKCVYSKQLNEDENISQNMRGTVKAVPTGKLIALNTSVRREKKSQINHLNSNFKN